MTIDKNMKRQVRRRDHIAKDLRTPKYRQRVVPSKRVEDDEERRFRRYQAFEENYEPYYPLDKDEDD